MVDSIDFNTLDLTAEFAQESQLSQTDAEQSQTDYDLSQSIEHSSFDNFQCDFFSPQHTQSPSLTHSSHSQSQENQCTNCKSYNTLQIDDKSGHKICTNCSHIVQVKQTENISFIQISSIFLLFLCKDTFIWIITQNNTLINDQSDNKQTGI